MNLYFIYIIINYKINIFIHIHKFMESKILILLLKFNLQNYSDYLKYA